jgi:nitric oxide reductase large subunit
MLEKISLSIFSSLEILLVAIYLAWTVRILKATRTIDAETCKRSHLKWLFLASIALITLTGAGVSGFLGCTGEPRGFDV